MPDSPSPFDPLQSAVPWIGLCIALLVIGLSVRAVSDADDSLPPDLPGTPEDGIPSPEAVNPESEFGPRNVVPADCDRRVRPNEDAVAIVADQPHGATVCFGAGVHRLSQPLVPRDGQRLLGEPDAVLSGSKLVRGWQQRNGHWYVDDQTQRLHDRGEERCRDGFPRCHRAENVFVDGAWLRHVDDVDDLEDGGFFFDYDKERIWIGGDPSGRTVEATVADHAIRSEADDVTVAGLTIEMFGNPAQDGAIHVEGSRWLIENNVIRLNHGVGIRTDGREETGNVIRRNRISHMGQLGIGGHGNDMLVEANEIAHNNQAGFAGGWEAGASKWVGTERLVVRNNHVYDNLGHGLWTDIDNIQTTYESNRSERNERSGIFHEISYSAIIRDNVVLDNGTDTFGWATGAGIRVANSSDVEVTGNQLAGNGNGIVLSMQDRGSGAHGLWELRDVHVQANHVTMTTGYTGLVQDVGDPSYFTDKGNRFTANAYVVLDAGAWWTWEEEVVTFGRWQDHGNDVTGSADVLED